MPLGLPFKNSIKRGHTAPAAAAAQANPASQSATDALQGNPTKKQKLQGASAKKIKGEPASQSAKLIARQKSYGMTREIIEKFTNRSAGPNMIALCRDTIRALQMKDVHLLRSLAQYSKRIFEFETQEGLGHCPKNPECTCNGGYNKRCPVGFNKTNRKHGLLVPLPSEFKDLEMLLNTKEADETVYAPMLLAIKNATDHMHQLRISATSERERFKRKFSKPLADELQKRYGNAQPIPYSGLYPASPEQLPYEIMKMLPKFSTGTLVHFLSSRVEAYMESLKGKVSEWAAFVRMSEYYTQGSLRSCLLSEKHAENLAPLIGLYALQKKLSDGIERGLVRASNKLVKNVRESLVQFFENFKREMRVACYVFGLNRFGIKPSYVGFQELAEARDEEREDGDDSEDEGNLDSFVEDDDTPFHLATALNQVETDEACFLMQKGKRRQQQRLANRESQTSSGAESLSETDEEEEFADKSNGSDDEADRRNGEKLYEEIILAPSFGDTCFRERILKELLLSELSLPKLGINIPVCKRKLDVMEANNLGIEAADIGDKFCMFCGHATESNDKKVCKFYSRSLKRDKREERRAYKEAGLTAQELEMMRFKEAIREEGGPSNSDDMAGRAETSIEETPRITANVHGNCLAQMIDGQFVHLFPCKCGPDGQPCFDYSQFDKSPAAADCTTAPEYWVHGNTNIVNWSAAARRMVEILWGFEHISGAPCNKDKPLMPKKCQQWIETYKTMVYSDKTSRGKVMNGTEYNEGWVHLTCVGCAGKTRTLKVAEWIGTMVTPMAFPAPEDERLHIHTLACPLAHIANGCERAIHLDLNVVAAVYPERKLTVNVPTWSNQQGMREFFMATGEATGLNEAELDEKIARAREDMRKSPRAPDTGQA